MNKGFRDSNKELEPPPAFPVKAYPSAFLCSAATTALLEITIHKGRNRQIRRMAEAAGLKTTRLQRVVEGGLSLGNLKPGQWRVLSNPELEQLTSDARGDVPDAPSVPTSDR